MTRTRMTALSCWLGLCCASQAFAAADIARGEKLYQVCAACHGTDGAGKAVLNTPRIQGQSDFYLLRQLKNFKARIRGDDPRDRYGAQVVPMVQPISEQEFEDVVAFIGTLPAAPKPPTTIAGDVAKGQVAFAVCAACHGPSGQGLEALNAPRIAGQQDWYVVRQLMNFKAGIRGAHPDDTFGAQMRPMAMTLITDEAVRDIAAYIATFD